MSDRAKGPYCRVYHSIVDDEKFREVYDNDAALATWLRLLIIADQAHPASASLPASAKRRVVELLQRVGLIDGQPGWRYRVHGLDAEREDRSQNARDAAAKRWHSKGNAPASDVRMPSRAEPSKAEPSRTRTALDSHTGDGLIHVTPPVEKAWVDACGISLRGSGIKAQDVIDDICRRHPEPKVLAAIQTARDAFPHIPEVNSLAYATRNILDPFLDPKAAQRATSEQREADAGRRRVQATKRQAHETGWHSEKADPACDACRAVA